MKKSWFTAWIFALSFCLLFSLPMALAQEGAAPAPATNEADEVDYSFGTVKSASAGEVVVSEYDYETDKDVDVAYTLDPKVELKNVDAADKIVAGDSIDITFIVKDGKKIAKSVSIEKIPAGADAIPVQ